MEMHLIDLGVQRKILNFFTEGKNTSVRLKSVQITEISSRMRALVKYVPHDFSRRPRGLEELKRWKATEYHFFLHHGGITVLKGVVTPVVYEHYLLLYVSIHLLSSWEYFEQPGILEYCNDLLKKFVAESMSIYGQHFLSYNVHNLVHVAENVRTYKEFGPLYTISAYPFENHLQIIKSLVVAKTKMLEQVVKRIDEIDRFQYRNVPETSSFITTSARHKQGPVYPPYVGQQFGKVRVGRLKLEKKEPDNIVILKDCSVFRIENILKCGNGDVFLIGRKVEDCGSFFTYPIDSQKIGITKFSRFSESMSIRNISEVKFKGCMLPLFGTDAGSYVVTPLSFPEPSINDS
jgi:hypothetical protein